MKTETSILKTNSSSLARRFNHRSKTWSLSALLFIVLAAAAPAQSVLTLVEDTFLGPAGSPPDNTLFVSGGDVWLDGAGALSFSTDSANQSWLLSKAAAAPALGETLVLPLRAAAYAEPAVYGDRQPRGLRMGNDASNAAEFYSIYGTIIGMRVSKDGSESLASYDFPVGVWSMHDYEISLTTTSVCFKVDGQLAGSFSANIPTGPLNAYVSTYDGGFGNVPVSLDSLSLTLTNSLPAPPSIAGFEPISGPPGTTVAIHGTNFVGILAVKFGALEATFTNNSTSLVTAFVPTEAASGLITMVSTNGTAVSSNSFGVAALDFICVTNNDATITIAGYTGSGGAVSIPASFFGLPVTIIGNRAFQSRGSVTSLTIPGTVTSIGHWAFSYCRGLATIAIPDSVTTVGNYAFAYSGNETSITLGAGLTSIGYRAFAYCSSLTNITLPASVSAIGNAAFGWCSSLTAIMVDPGNSSYTGNADGVLFDKNQTTLLQYPAGKLATGYAVPNSVTGIAEGAFSGCAALTSVSIPDSVVKIGYAVFESCASLAAITIPNSVSDIGAYAFSMCRSLTNITLGDGITSISDHMFYNCSSLTVLTLPASVANVGNYAFFGCSILTDLYFQGNVPTAGAFLFSSDNNATIYYLTGTTGWEATFGGRPTVLLSPVVVLVQDEFTGGAGDPPDASRFEWNGEVAQNGAGQLGFGTWSVDQSSLSSKAGAAPGPGQTLLLQLRASAYAEGWEPGIYGDGQPRGLRVGSDPNNALEFFSISRTSVGMRVRKDGVEALVSCSLASGVDSMHDYEISVTVTSVCFSVDGTLVGTFAANIPEGTLNVYVGTYDGGGVGNVPVGLDSLSLSLSGRLVQSPPLISGFAPTNGPIGTSVTINGASFIGVTAVRFAGVDAAFTNNSVSLITAVVPDNAVTGVITILSTNGTASSADNFVVAPMDFTFLTNNGSIRITGYTGSDSSVTIPATILGLIVTRIGNNAFTGATLTNLTLPSSVTNIADYAFGMSSSLTSINADSLNPAFSSLNGVLFDKTQSTLMHYPPGKTGTYTIPDSVTSVAPLAFYLCTSLTSVTIPSSVTSLQFGAFAWCTGLTNLTLPGSVTSLASQCFYYCTSLSHLTLSEGLASIGSYEFAGSSLTSLVLPSSVTDIGYSAFANSYYLTTVIIPGGATNISPSAFASCTNLQSVFFKGNAFTIDPSVFSGDSKLVVFYLPGSTGWDVTFAGRPAHSWNPQAQPDPAFGVTTNQFGFTITGTDGLVVVVEDCADPANPQWSAVSTNTLTGGASYFNDPQSTNLPARFYRLRSP